MAGPEPGSRDPWLREQPSAGNDRCWEWGRGTKPGWGPALLGSNTAKGVLGIVEGYGGGCWSLGTWPILGSGGQLHSSFPVFLGWNRECEQWLGGSMTWEKENSCSIHGAA